MISKLLTKKKMIKSLCGSCFIYFLVANIELFFVLDTLKSGVLNKTNEHIYVENTTHNYMAEMVIIVICFTNQKIFA